MKKMMVANKCMTNIRKINVATMNCALDKTYVYFVWGIRNAFVLFAWDSHDQVDGVRQCDYMHSPITQIQP